MRWNLMNFQAANVLIRIRAEVVGAVVAGAPGGLVEVENKFDVSFVVFSSAQLAANLKKKLCL